jgi:hypothetical protein
MSHKKEKKAWLRIIGDVHGKYDKYLPLTKESEYSLCVGDVGFDYSYLEKFLNPVYHKSISGNHDNYTKKICPCTDRENCRSCDMRGYTFPMMSKHFLGDYGVWDVPDFGEIFFVRGAWSIDKQWRIPGVSWWEELSYAQGLRALELYEKLKPDFVVTHTVPSSIIPEVPFKRIFGDTIHGSRTESLLDNLYYIHQPKKWIFGHWHVDWKREISHPKTENKTEFMCLNELSFVDFPKKDLDTP